MALAPVAYVLYTEAMRHDPGAPDWPDRDRFVLSAGHACILQYAALHLTGYDLHDGRPEAVPPVGVADAGPSRAAATPPASTSRRARSDRASANAVGMAIAEQMLAARYNRDGHEIVNHRTFAICSDGDLMEGVSGEASSIAGFLGLGKLCLIYDDNHITIEGSTDLAFGEDVPARYEAYGWHVAALRRHAGRSTRCARRSRPPRPRPTVPRSSRCARTSRTARRTRRTPRRRMAHRSARKRSGSPSRPTAGIPTSTSTCPTASTRRWTSARAAASAARDGTSASTAYRAAHPELAAEFERVLAGRLPDGWERGLPDLSGVELAGDARELERLHPRARGDRARARRRLGRSRSLHQHADRGRRLGLAPLVRRSQLPLRHPRARDGRDPERHGRPRRASACSARPSCSSPTTCDPRCVSRRSRASPSTYVWTHDSIGLGEDGPTHQPIEHYAALRAILNLRFVRPGRPDRDGRGVALRDDAPGRARRRSR